jgi:hypothetical protein
MTEPGVIRITTTLPSSGATARIWISRRTCAIEVNGLVTFVPSGFNVPVDRAAHLGQALAELTEELW